MTKSPIENRAKATSDSKEKEKRRNDIIQSRGLLFRWMPAVLYLQTLPISPSVEKLMRGYAVMVRWHFSHSSHERKIHYPCEIQELAGIWHQYEQLNDLKTASFINQDIRRSEKASSKDSVDFIAVRLISRLKKLNQTTFEGLRCSS